MIKGKILWVENDPDFLNVRSEFIETAGYKVVPAFTLAEADQVLQDEWVNLIILDIRMDDNDDPWDKSGLEWANQELYRWIPKIILTAFVSHPDVVKTLRPGANLAVDFLDKEIEPEEMIEAIDQAFTQHVRLNLDLIFPANTFSFYPHLIGLNEAETEYIRIPNRVAELEDLFRRLFYDYSQITITRLFTGRTKRLPAEAGRFADD
jgi:DNA-binding NtrC family response regulator